MFDYASLAHQISLILPLNDNDDENSHKSKTTDEHDNNNDGFSNIGSDFSHLYDSLVLLLSSKLEAKEGKTNSSTRLIESDTCSYYDVLGCKTNPLVESLTTVLQENEKDGGIPANKTINVTSP